MQKTHWKKIFNPNYMGAYSFNEGERKELRIKSVKVEPVTGRDGKAEDCTVIYFDGNEKPLICNKTNAKAIAHVTGSNYIEDWIGVMIALVTKEVRAFGDVVDAVRVEAKKVKEPIIEKEVLTTDHASFSKALAAVEAGHYTVKAIQSKYDISPDALAALKNAEDEAV